MTIILFVLILSLLIFVHEFGHFITAKKSGIKVEEFGFGLPPRLAGKKIGETLYSINLLPLGGFVRLFGEDRAVSSTDTQDVNRAFYDKQLLVRLMVLVAGVTMNMVLGIACFSVIYLRLGVPTKIDKVMVAEVVKGSPADLAGVKSGEYVFKLANEEVNSTKQFIELTKSAAGKKLTLVVGDDSRVRDVTIVPRANPPNGEGPLGVIITDTVMRKYAWYQMPYLVVREGFKEAISWSSNILNSLKTMLVGLVREGKVPQDVAGPIGIYQITGQAAKAGKLAVVQFIGILSINLAIINLLPLPALDGGRIMFLAYEALTRKRINPRYENWANNIGLLFLLGLMVIITINDIVRLI